MTHTETPWQVEEGHIQRDSGGIRYWQITNGQDAIACNQFCYAGYDPDVNIANAARIVHCVNTHDALVKALEGCIPSGVCLTNSNIPDDTIVPIDATMGEFRAVAAALALAKGEGE